MIDEVIDISNDNLFDIESDKVSKICKLLKIENYSKRLNKRNYDLNKKQLLMIDHIQRKLLKYYCNKLSELYDCKHITIYSYEPVRSLWLYERFMNNDEISYEAALSCIAFRFNCIISFVHLKDRGLLLINNNTYIKYKNDIYKPTIINPDLLLELDFYCIKHDGILKLYEI